MKNKNIKTWTNIKLLFTTVVQSNKLYFPSLIFFALADAGNNLINIFVPMIFIKGLNRTWDLAYFGKILIYLLAGKLLLAFLVKRLKVALDIQEEKLKVAFPRKIGEKAMALKYSALEESRILDLKERASFAVNNFNVQANILNALAISLSLGFTLLGAGTLIASFSPVLLGLIIFLCLLISYTDYKMSAYTRQMAQDLIPINRKYSYYCGLAFDPAYQKEIRLFAMDDLIMDKTQSYINDVFVNLVEMYRKEGSATSLTGALQVLIRFLSYSYALLRVAGEKFGPRISLEQFTVLLGGVESFISSFKAIFASIFNIKMALFHLEPFSEFLLLEEDGIENQGDQVQDFKSLKFDHVTFAYPGSDRKILDDISFEIKNGEKISIVGINNAGKTTIVKLICGFFTPDSGRILLNDREISSYNKESYLKSLACVFQDFSLFPLTIEENIYSQAKADEEKLENILTDLDMKEKIFALDQGIKSKFDKSIYSDAIDLSGGEKQKLAIARALYRDGDLIILDEPTAALDPLAEAEIYENFNQLTHGKTAIFISHRMSSTKFTDKVLVLDGGKVVAFDSHEKLLKINTIYKDLFQAQAQYFKE